jgi:hypothetical protein
MFSFGPSLLQLLTPRACVSFDLDGLCVDGVCSDLNVASRAWTRASVRVSRRVLRCRTSAVRTRLVPVDSEVPAGPLAIDVMESERTPQPP